MHGQFSATGSLIPLPWKVCCTLYLNIYKEEGAVYLFYIFNSGILETTVSGILYCYGGLQGENLCSFLGKKVYYI